MNRKPTNPNPPAKDGKGHGNPKIPLQEPTGQSAPGPAACRFSIIRSLGASLAFASCLAEASEPVKLVATHEGERTNMVIKISSTTISEGGHTFTILPDEEFIVEFEWNNEFVEEPAGGGFEYASFGSPTYDNGWNPETITNADGDVEFSMDENGQIIHSRPSAGDETQTYCQIPFHLFNISGACAYFHAAPGDTQWTKGLPSVHGTPVNLSPSMQDCEPASDSATFRVRITDPNDRSDNSPCASCSGGGGGGGGGGSSFGASNYSDSFGSGSNPTTQAPTGPVQLSFPLSSDAAITPESVSFQPAAGVATTDTTANGVRTIVTPHSRVEIEAVGNAVEVRIFDGNIAGAPANHVRRYSRALDDDYGHGVRLEVVENGTTTVNDTFENVSPDGSSASWKIVVTRGDRVTETLAAATQGSRLVTTHERFRLADGTLVDLDRTQKNYVAYTWGLGLSSESRGIGSEQVNTIYSYLPSGALASWTSSDGTWERNLHDAAGRHTHTLRPWLDSPASPGLADATNCHTTVHLPDGATETKILGITVATHSTQETPVAFPPNQLVARRIDSTTTTALGTVTTTSFYAAAADGGEGLGRYLGSLQGDRLSSHSTTKGNWDPVAKTFAQNSNGTATRSITTEGTWASPLGVPHQSTRTVTYSDATGTRRSDLEVFTGASSYALLSRTDYDYDAQSRLVAVLRDGDLVSSTVYHAIGSRTVTGEDGSATTYAAEGPSSENSSQTSHGGALFPDLVSSSTTTYGPNGATTTQSRSAGGLSISSSSASTHGGRLLSSTDELGRTTTYARTHDPATGRRTETETGPGGVTRILTYHRDGQLHSITGSGVVPEFYEYSVANGLLVTTVRQGAADSPRWRRTYTDGHGRLVREESPLPGGRVQSRIHHYDNQGRLVRVERSGLADERTAYDALGRPFRRGLDLDGNGALDPASTDRLVESEQFYENADGGWWEVSVTSTYLTPGDATKTELSRVRRRLGLGAGGRTIVTRADGTAVDTLTTVDRATGTTTVTADANFSNLNAVSVYRYGRLVSQSSFTVAAPTLYGYDALGRVVSVTDPRTGLATTMTYNAAGQQLSVTRPGGLTTTYGYYPATHANAGALHWSADGLGKRSYRAYNARGQLTHQWGPATYPLRHLYDAYGAMTGLHTWRAGDPGDWDGEAIPAAFNATAPDLTTWVYDAASGLLLQKKDHAGRGPVYAYHDSGLLQSRTWARGIVASYGWNPSGDLASVGYSDGTPGANRTHRRDGSLASVTDAAGTTSYGYNGAVASGESVQGGLLDGLTLSYPQAGGRRQSFTASVGGDTVSLMGYAYDTRGRLASVGETSIGAGGFSAEFEYVPDSDLPHTTSSKAGANPVLTGTRSYDAANRLASVGFSRPGNGLVTSHTYTLDAADRRTRAEREDGTAWVYGYNERDEVVSAVKLLPGEELLAGWQQEFGYDNLGNRKFAHEGGDAAGANRRQLDYTVNALNQYTSISHPGTFDVLGRAPSNVGVTVNGSAVSRQGEFWRREFGGLPNALAAVWQSVQVDAVDPGAGPNGTDLTARRSGHRFVPMAVETPFYDFDGNLVADARWVYQWDGENRLVEVTTAAPALAAGVPRERYRYAYDSRSRRIARTVESWDLDAGEWVLEKSERFVYDDWNVVAVVDAAGAVVQRYVWGNDLSGTPQGAGGVGGLLAASDVASGRSWCYAYDGNGNVSAVVDLADGAKAGRYDYDAFGRTIATWGDEGLAGANPYRFSTKPKEGTGLYYYGYRWYDAENGRWLGRDPIGVRGGVNLYGMVGNRPISIVDRLGMTCIKEITVRFDSSESAPQLFSPDEYGNPDPNRPVPTSGRVFHGQMCAYGFDDNVIKCWSIKSGGFRSGDSKVEQDDDTAVPAGNYKVQTKRTGDLQGYLVVGTPQRYGIMIHDAIWGTQGCLGVLSEYESLHGHMTDTREKIKRDNVPIRIRYTMTDGTARPTGNRGFGNSDPDYPDDLPPPLDTEGPPGSGSNFPFN